MQISFNRRTDLALAALRALGVGGTMSGSALAEAVGTSLGFLPQVMSPLVRAGWVVSVRGPGGGYAIGPDGESISVLDVIEATQGPAADGRCVLRGSPCPGDEECPVHHAWLEAREVLVRRLETVPAIDAEGGTP